MPENSSDSKLGTVIGFTLFTSHLSGITVLCCLTSNVLKTCLVYLFQLCSCFEQEVKSSSCYYILDRIGNLKIGGGEGPELHSGAFILLLLRCNSSGMSPDCSLLRKSSSLHPDQSACKSPVRVLEMNLQFPASAFPGLIVFYFILVWLSIQQLIYG